uniref:Protein aurora borealis n=1 Tax=Culicoides sonorensis TaxID=179676 RepID=A0A336KAC7_CULSO
MEHEIYKTPNKVFSSPRIRVLHQQQQSGLTPGSLQKKNRHKFHLIPVINTSSSSPSCTRFPKIVNPFEQHLADRLHLPVICSPSLFHRPATPQLSSTQFEWTIDDVSSLAPAKVEVSELQFQQCHDPELEERAQAAINSYFKENEIVPSPMDCQLRNQKIVLRNESSIYMSSINGSGSKRVRNGICQTELTFPPILPKEIEDLLSTFCTFTQDQQQSLTPNDCDTTVDYEARDLSLRRKLFDVSVGPSTSDLHDSLHDIDLQALSPPPKTPELDKQRIKNRTRNFGTPLGSRSNILSENSPINISISPVKNDTFGSLSPISKVSSTTPTVKHIKKRVSSTSSLSDDKENINNENSSSNSSLYQSTPEKTRLQVVSSSVDMSIDRSHGILSNRTKMSVDDYTEDSWDVSSCDDQISSSQRQKNSTTPVTRHQRRSRIASKNLSHSFSLFAGDKSLMDDEVLREVVGMKSETASFYRTDSGFTETSNMTSVDDETSDLVSSSNNKKQPLTLVFHDENSMDISMRSDLQF